VDEVGLAFPHAREVAKLARRFRASRLRGFVVCVGASEAVRARVEAALADRLDDGALRSTRIANGVDDPWSVLLGARTGEAQLVSARLEGEAEIHTLRALDVRRELLQGERLALLLWVSLGAMERVASLAPNLWSYRSDVAWFLSHDDIEASIDTEVEEVPFAPSIEELLLRVEDALTWTRAQRTQLLAVKAWLLKRLGRTQEALATLDLVKPALRAGSDEEQDWRDIMLKILLEQRRLQEAQVFVERGRGNNAPKTRGLEQVRLALESTEWRGAFDRLDQAVASAYQWDIGSVERRLGPECVRAAKDLIALGQLAAAERWLDEAMKATHRRASDWWPMVAAHVEELRALVAWERLDAVSALQHQQRRIQVAERIGALDVQVHALERIQEGYAALGLSNDSQAFRERAQQVAARMRSDPKPSEPSSDTPERPVDTPFARLERAVHDAERALDTTPPGDAVAALDRCAEAWAAEDVRYRSWRLFDRWQQALARHLVALGEEDRAIAVLRDAAEQLRDLPRTRLGTLLALAKLPTGPDYANTRETAAAEVLSHASTAVSGALDLERDARRALAPFARARGDLEEADFHEAEADRIATALAPVKRD